MEKTLKELTGHSGSQIYLMEDVWGLFIRKINNVERNLERLSTLYSFGYPVPKIYNYGNNVLDMEYIHGLDMKNYLIHHNIEDLSNFIISTLENFSKKSVMKDYTGVYNEKLKWMDQNDDLPFNKEEFIERLPKILPSSMYHGDMTLENIIGTNKNKFYMIDAVKVEYDSYIFDIAKMRQDLECKWFLRNDSIRIDVKLKNLQEQILSKFEIAKDNNLLILMLLRVYLHTKKNDFNYNFIMKEIKRLWK